MISLFRRAERREQQQRYDGLVAAHNGLLRTAARLSHVVIECHTDTWKFIAEHAFTRHTGRYVYGTFPGERLTDFIGENRLHANVSGVQLVMLLDAMFEAAWGTAEYERIRAAIAGGIYDTIEAALDRVDVDQPADPATGPGPMIRLDAPLLAPLATEQDQAVEEVYA